MKHEVVIMKKEYGHKVGVVVGVKSIKLLNLLSAFIMRIMKNFSKAKSHQICN